MLLLAHSVFEEFIHQCLEISVLCDPYLFKSEIEKKKESIKNVLNEDPDEIYQRRLKEHISNLMRESLPANCEMLNNLIRVYIPSPNLHFFG